MERESSFPGKRVWGMTSYCTPGDGPASQRKLEDIAAGENLDGVAGLEGLAVGGDDEEAVGLRECGDVARTLPVQRADLRLQVRMIRGPFDARGEEMSEAGLLAHGFG